MKEFFVFLLAAVSVSVTSGRVLSAWDYHREQNTSRVIQGTRAMNGDIPYQIRLTIIGTGLGLCGGSIIGPNWVLTAGHCAKVQPPLVILGFYIEAGSVVANFPNQARLVLPTNVYPHPGYNPTTRDNDIAILKTEIAFDFTTTLVKPIKLVAAYTDKNSYVEQFITVSGFGATTDGGSGSNFLYYTPDLQVISFTTCQTVLSSQTVPLASFCAEDTIPQISSVCIGDSGGPATLVIDDTLYQIGVVSYASNAGCDNGPQGFANVAEFVPWILSITGPL